MPQTTPMRIGVFGGTFDPPHFGHLAAALEVRHSLGLDTVLMVVANDPWQKSSSRAITPPAVRLEMVCAAVAGIAGLEASALEVDRGGESYTADTLEELRHVYPGAELMLMVGTDAAAGLHTWKRPEELRRLATTVLFSRPDGSPAGGDVTDPQDGVGSCCLGLPRGWPAVAVEVPELIISSRDIRSRFAEGRPVEALTPRAVIDVVRSHGLYGCGP